MQKSSKSESTGKWVGKMQSSRATGCYPAETRNGVQTPATTWMNPDNILLSERTQTQKVTYYTIPLLWNAQNRQIHGARKHIMVARGWGRGSREWQVTTNGRGVSVWNKENVLELVIIVHCECTKYHWTVCCKMVNFTLDEFHFNEKTLGTPAW